MLPSPFMVKYLITVFISMNAVGMVGIFLFSFSVNDTIAICSFNICPEPLRFTSRDKRAVLSVFPENRLKYYRNMTRCLRL